MERSMQNVSGVSEPDAIWPPGNPTLIEFCVAQGREMEDGVRRVSESNAHPEDEA